MGVEEAPDELTVYTQSVPDVNPGPKLSVCVSVDESDVMDCCKLLNVTSPVSVQ